jgi:hypothetical protein
VGVADSPGQVATTAEPPLPLGLFAVNDAQALPPIAAPQSRPAQLEHFRGDWNRKGLPKRVPSVILGLR